MELLPGGRPEPGAAALLHAEGLLHLARFLTRDAAEAEDLVQETYARAFRAMARAEPGGELKPWLFRILRNAFLDTRRRDRRNPVEPDDGRAEERPQPEEGALRGDRELERLRGLVGAEIEAALRTLSDDARQVVLLDLEGLAEAEIALVMGCAPGTVKSRLARARAALRARLADYRREG